MGALREHGRTPAGIVEMHPGRIGNRIQGAEVFRPEYLPEAGFLPLIVSVARHENREKIRLYLLERGWVEGRDYISTA